MVRESDVMSFFPPFFSLRLKDAPQRGGSRKEKELRATLSFCEVQKKEEFSFPFHATVKRSPLGGEGGLIYY